MQSELQEKIKKFILNEKVADPKIVEAAFAEAKNKLQKFHSVMEFSYLNKF